MAKALDTQLFRGEVQFFFSFLSPQIEHSLLRESFAALARQMDLIFKKKLWYIMLEQFFMKYLWGLSGKQNKQPCHGSLI